MTGGEIRKDSIIWSEGEPNQDEKGDCSYMTLDLPDNPRMNDYECNENYGFICQIQEY